MPFTIDSLAPYLGVTGVTLLNLDENTTGADDFAGALLLYSGEVLAAVGGDRDIPEFPDALKHGISDKISTAAKVPLIVASSILTLAQFQVSGTAAKALKYVNQAIRSLLSGTPIPATAGL